MTTMDVPLNVQTELSHKVVFCPENYPLDLSSRSLIPFHYQVVCLLSSYIDYCIHHSFRVTFFILGSRFFYFAVI